MKQTLAFLICLAITATAFAQEFEVPTGFSFKTEDDFKKYEPDILRGIDWVLATPADAALEKRQDAAFFIMSWLDKNPSIKVEVDSKVVNFMEANPDLVLIFLCGWTKYTIETGDGEKVNGNVKGLESVVEYYVRNKGKLQKDKHIDKYVKMKEEGQLEQFVRKAVG